MYILCCSTTMHVRDNDTPLFWTPHKIKPFLPTFCHFQHQKQREAGTQSVQIESVVHAFYPHKIMYQALSAFGTASGKKLGRARQQSKYCRQHLSYCKKRLFAVLKTLQKCVNCVYLLVTPDTIHQRTNKEPPVTGVWEQDYTYTLLTSVSWTPLAHLVDHCYLPTPSITAEQLLGGYHRLLKITDNYWRLQKITEDYWKLLEITEDYWSNEFTRLQIIWVCCMGIPTVTEIYCGKCRTFMVCFQKPLLVGNSCSTQNKVQVPMWTGFNSNASLHRNDPSTLMANMDKAPVQSILIAKLWWRELQLAI